MFSVVIRKLEMETTTRPQATRQRLPSLFSHHNVIDKQAPVLPDTRVMAVLLCYLRYQKVLLMFIEATVPGHCYCVHATDNDSILVPLMRQTKQRC